MRPDFRARTVAGLRWARREGGVGQASCVTPFQGSITDPAVSERLQKDPDSLPVHCQAHKVTPAPKEQQVTVQLP